MNPIEKLVCLAKSVKRDHITIRTIIAEEVGIPCIKVDTPDLQPGDRVEVTIKPIESDETRERVRREMSCKWFTNGGDCGKGLPGTPCSIIGCVAWEQSTTSKREKK